MRTEEERRTTLDMERSRISRAFEWTESLWKLELGKLFRLLGQHSEALALTDSGDRSRQPTLAIAIFGTYGSGKSSLLKTFAKLIHNDDRRDNHSASEGGNDRVQAFALPVIDQGLFSENGHFLYAFLATALEAALHKSHRGGGEHLQDTLSPVQRDFHNFSEYLQVVDKTESFSDRDPLGHSLERLERHSSGVLLKVKLDEWLDLLAEELNGSARKNSLVVLPVDDADMSLRDLVTTLRIFRRYLTHPRLVPIFTFTDRQAEELLRSYFASCLSIDAAKSDSSEWMTQPGKDSPYSLDIAERLAYQYLVKLFPIRNRIRLGPAPARAQAAVYQIVASKRPGGGGVEKAREDVHDLLWTASEVLFGSPEWPSGPKARLALRPSTLRRQLQVIDAMIDAQVMMIRKEVDIDSSAPKATESADLPTTWAAIFDKAAWSLLNIHRDALAEHGLYVEDLYSWTPETLRRALLDYILEMDLGRRRRLIKQWRYRIEDRRSQVISLLAANTFRPQMMGEELSGDDPDKINQLRSTMTKTMAESVNSFSLLKGVLWFLNLWIGFYLPQILARNRQDDISDRDQYKGRVGGVGWDLQGGPTHAIREALSNGGASSTGMMLLEPNEFSHQIQPGIHAGNDGQQQAKSELDAVGLLLHIWCFYGHERGAWSAVSFWRGLALLGKLLVLWERELFKSVVEPTRQQTSGFNQDQRNKIEVLISDHCARARVPGVFGEDQVEYDPFRPESKSHEIVKNLAGSVHKWLTLFQEKRVYPFNTRAFDRSRSASESVSSRDSSGLMSAGEADWRNCFLRRMHGDYILGDFWRMLEGVYLERPEATHWEEPRRSGETPTANWTAWTAMTKWTEVLLTYTEKGRGAKGDRRDGGTGPIAPSSGEGQHRFGQASRITLFFASCPIIRPFISRDRERELKAWEERASIEAKAATPESTDTRHKEPDGEASPAAESETGDKVAETFDSFFDRARISPVFDFLERLPSFNGGPNE